VGVISCPHSKGWNSNGDSKTSNSRRQFDRREGGEPFSEDSLPGITAKGNILETPGGIEKTQDGKTGLGRGAIEMAQGTSPERWLRGSWQVKGGGENYVKRFKKLSRIEFIRAQGSRTWNESIPTPVKTLEIGGGEVGGRNESAGFRSN